MGAICVGKGAGYLTGGKKRLDKQHKYWYNIRVRPDGPGKPMSRTQDRDFVVPKASLGFFTQPRAAWET